MLHVVSFTSIVTWLMLCVEKIYQMSETKLPHRPTAVVPVVCNTVEHVLEFRLDFNPQ